MIEPTAVVPTYRAPQVPQQQGWGQHDPYAATRLGQAPAAPGFRDPLWEQSGWEQGGWDQQGQGQQGGGWGQPAPPPRRRRTGLIVGVVVGVLVLLGALAAAAVLLLAPRQLSTADVQSEIVRVTQEEVGVAPVDVRCPGSIEVAAGTTTTCTATLDGQALTYGVRQDDDQGNLTITHDRTLLVAELDSTASALLSAEVGEEVVVACGVDGQTVLVNAPGAPMACGAANVADPTLTAAVTVTVDEAGTVTYEVL